MTTAPSAVLQLETLRWKALTDNDLDLLETLFADDMTYTHSNGMLDSKESYLGALRKGAFRYLSINVSDTHSHCYGDTTVVTGRAVATTTSAAGELVSMLVYTAVWSLVDDQWRFIAWHSCAATA